MILPGWGLFVVVIGVGRGLSEGKRTNSSITRSESKATSDFNIIEQYKLTSFEVRKNVMQISWLHIECAASQFA